jgi:hypothetical protein
VGTYCADNPQYLTITDIKTVATMLLNQDKNNSVTYMNEAAFVKKHCPIHTTRIDQCHRYNHPSEIIKQRLSRSEIIKEQKKEFENIYTSCLGGTDFEFIDEHSLDKAKYKQVNDLLMIYSGFTKYTCPPV